jgi:2-succinyl-5-enolpyruvyl-6-hydroxy-3-cyclohexene-1-carboxylate synthase
LPLTNAIESDYFKQLDAVKALRKLKKIYLDKILFDFKVLKSDAGLPINSQLQISNSSATDMRNYRYSS